MIIPDRNFSFNKDTVNSTMGNMDPAHSISVYSCSRGEIVHYEVHSPDTRQ